MEFPLCSRIRDAMQRHLSSTQNTYTSTGRETRLLKYRGDRARPSNEARIALRMCDKLSLRDKNEARTL